jgi:6-phosphogluconolactonase
MNIVDKISDELDKHEKRYEFASLVVCGGTSVLNIFKELSKKEINWKNIVVTLVDDRLVPDNHADSNRLLVKKHLLINNASKAKFLSLDSRIISCDKIKLPFTVMLLSMGCDGHFASIFPDMLDDKNAANPESKPKVLKTTPQGTPNHARITMNLAMILESKSIFLLVHGKNKIRTLDLARTNQDLPINRLLKAASSNLIIDKLN